MNTTMTAIKKAGKLVGVVILFAVMYTSCKIPSADAVSAIPAGTIKVSFGSSASTSTRTAVPDLAANIAVYVLSCTNTTAGTASTAEISGTASYEFTNVIPGSVTIAISAYSSATTKDSTTLIATGSSSITLGSGEGANVTIPLKMESSGNPGKISLAIQWPASLADGIEWSIDGTAQTTPTITSSGGNSGTTLSASPVAAGSHIIRIAFKSGSATIGTLPESVNVYANLMTDKWVDASGNLANTKIFTANDFGTTGTDVLLLITSGTNSYTAGLSSTNASTAINVPSSATGIVFMPTAVTTGQTIQYAWGAGLYATISSGQPLSLAFAGTAMDLSLKVTDPSGSATVTYIVTVKPATEISSPTELAGMSLAGNYVLTSDIDLSSYGTWTPTGSASTNFIGTFDGGGHTVSNLSVATTASYAGMFGYVGTGAVVSNVQLKNVNVNGGTSSAFVGGLAGYNMGTIYRCSTVGTFSGYRSVGGLVGESQGTIRECYSMGSVSCSGYTAGGLVGFDYGEISNCYARCTVSGPTKCGGLIGGHANNATISTTSYAAGTVTIQSGTVYGGLEGFSYGGGDHFTNCFYDSSLTPGGDDAGTGTARPTASMKSETPFTAAGWDFGSVWTRDSSGTINAGYPYLRNVVPDNCVTVSFDANGATSGTGPADICAIPGKYMSIPAAGSLTKTGYTFAGWALDNLGNQNYMPGNRCRVPNYHLTLYAKWANNLFSEDCESLLTGNLNGQGGWTTTLHNTSVDMQVTAGSGTPVNSTKFFSYDTSGSGVGVDCMHSLGTPIDLTGSDVYRVSFDLSNSAWGDYAGLSYGTDYAVGVKMDGGTTATLTLPNGTTNTYSLGSGFTYKGWWRVEITMFNSYITVQILSLETGEWFTAWSGQALITNSSGTDKTNPAHWDTFFGHMEGANCMLDNMKLEKQ